MFSRAYDENHFIVCFKYNKIDHKIFECNTNRIDHTLVKQIWILKEIMNTNTNGPKKAWVPKLKKWFCTNAEHQIAWKEQIFQKNGCLELKMNGWWYLIKAKLNFTLYYLDCWNYLVYVMDFDVFCEYIILSCIYE